MDLNAVKFKTRIVHESELPWHLTSYSYVKLAKTSGTLERKVVNLNSRSRETNMSAISQSYNHR